MKPVGSSSGRGRWRARRIPPATAGPAVVAGVGTTGLLRDKPAYPP